MRELRFKQYTMHCAGGIWTRGTLKDLLCAMPYVLDRFAGRADGSNLSTVGRVEIEMSS